jgi:hypothetical protein
MFGDAWALLSALMFTLVAQAFQNIAHPKQIFSPKQQVNIVHRAQGAFRYTVGASKAPFSTNTSTFCWAMQLTVQLIADLSPHYA